MASAGGWLGRSCCAFSGCSWHSPSFSSNHVEFYRADHPCVEWLRQHVLERHVACIHERANAFLPNIVARACAWDIYREAQAVQERKKWPTVGAAIDKRIFAYTIAVYNDEKIKAHICFACAGSFPKTSRICSDIMISSGHWLFSFSNKCLRDHFSWALFRRRSVAPGLPLHPLSAQDCDGANANYKC